MNEFYCKYEKYFPPKKLKYNLKWILFYVFHFISSSTLLLTQWMPYIFYSWNSVHFIAAHKQSLTQSVQLITDGEQAVKVFKPFIFFSADSWGSVLWRKFLTSRQVFVEWCVTFFSEHCPKNSLSPGLHYSLGIFLPNCSSTFMPSTVTFEVTTLIFYVLLSL